MTSGRKQLGAVLMAVVMITSSFVIFAGAAVADETERGDSGDDVTGDVGGDGNSGIGNGNDNGGRPDDRGPPDDRGRPDTPARPGDGDDDSDDDGDADDGDVGNDDGDVTDGGSSGGDFDGGVDPIDTGETDELNDRNDGRSSGSSNGQIEVVSENIPDTHTLVGEEVVVTVTVENFGNHDRRFSAVLIADSTVMDRERGIVEGGEQRTFTFVVSFDESDSYNLYIRGDHIGKIFVYDTTEDRDAALIESN